MDEPEFDPRQSELTVTEAAIEQLDAAFRVIDCWSKQS